ETLAIAVPPLVFDFAAETDVWQRLLSTPVSGPQWSTLSPMLYSSMIRAAMPRKSRALTHAIFAEALQRLVQASGTRFCLSLGVVGTGKLGDETSYAAPEELAADVGLAQAAGI